MPVAQIGPRAVAYNGSDRSNVPPTLARRGIAPNHVIVLEQLTEVRSELITLINGIEPGGDVSGETAARIAADLALEQSLTAQINNIALQGIRQKIAVGARVSELPVDLNSVPGFTPGATSPSGRLFVDSGDANSGIYQAVGGVLTRDPAFMTAADFQPGLMIWVDGNTAVDANSFWVLEDAATGAGDNVTANFEPFGRMQDLLAASGGALSIVGDTITWNYDAAFLAVVNGNATLSDIFKARIDAIESDANQAVADIAEIKVVNNQQASAIAGLVTENNQQGISIAALSDRTSTVEGTVATHATNIANISARTSTVEGTVATKADTTIVAALSARTTVVESGVSTNTADISLLSARTSTVESALPGKADVTTVNTLSARTSTVESALPTKADTSVVTALSARTSTVESVIAAITTVRVLTGGVAELFTEPDGTKWTKTSFTATFPAGSKYRLLATTLVAAPKTTLSEHAQPSYPGNTCIIPFFTPVGVGNALMPIDNDTIEALFVNFAAAGAIDTITRILTPGSSVTFTNGARFVVNSDGVFTAIRADGVTQWGPSPTDWLELKVNSAKGMAFARLDGTYRWTKLSADFFVEPSSVITQAEYNDF